MFSKYMIVMQFQNNAIFYCLSILFLLEMFVDELIPMIVLKVCFA